MIRLQNLELEAYQEEPIVIRGIYPTVKFPSLLHASSMVIVVGFGIEEVENEEVIWGFFFFFFQNNLKCPSCAQYMLFKGQIGQKMV